MDSAALAKTVLAKKSREPADDDDGDDDSDVSDDEELFASNCMDALKEGDAREFASCLKDFVRALG